MKKIKKAFVIDDDEIFVTLVEIQMQKSGLFQEIVSFPNGEDAIINIEEILINNLELPDFILLDLNMPIMDGWQFLSAYEKLKITVDIPIFIATSSIDPRDFEKSKEIESIVDFVSKPIRGEKIQEMVSKITS